MRRLNRLLGFSGSSIVFRAPTVVPDKNIELVLTVFDMCRYNVRNEQRYINDEYILVDRKSHEIYIRRDAPLIKESPLSIEYTMDDEGNDELVLYVPPMYLFPPIYSQDSINSTEVLPITRFEYKEYYLPGSLQKNTK